MKSCSERQSDVRAPRVHKGAREPGRVPDGHRCVLDDQVVDKLGDGRDQVRGTGDRDVLPDVDRPQQSVRHRQRGGAGIDGYLLQEPAIRHASEVIDVQGHRLSASRPGSNRHDLDRFPEKVKPAPTMPAMPGGRGCNACGRRTVSRVRPGVCKLDSQSSSCRDPPPSPLVRRPGPHETVTERPRAQRVVGSSPRRDMQLQHGHPRCVRPVGLSSVPDSVSNLSPRSWRASRCRRYRLN